MSVKWKCYRIFRIKYEQIIVYNYIIVLEYKLTSLGILCSYAFEAYRCKLRIIDIDVGYVYLCCKILQTVKALVPFDIIVRYAYFVGRLSETAASHLMSKVSIKKKVYPIVFWTSKGHYGFKYRVFLKYSMRILRQLQEVSFGITIFFTWVHLQIGSFLQNVW